jgi:hypothetical protein
MAFNQPQYFYIVYMKIRNNYIIGVGKDAEGISRDYLITAHP